MLRDEKQSNIVLMFAATILAIQARSFAIFSLNIERTARLVNNVKRLY
jgi:hypothetical protein